MHKVKSPSCACNPGISENIPHILLYCEIYDEIRQECIPKLLNMNTQLMQISDYENLLVISILDPLTSKLPENITSSWSSVSGVYALSRKFCHRIHLKREKNLPGIGQQNMIMIYEPLLLYKFYCYWSRRPLLKL